MDDDTGGKRRRKSRQIKRENDPRRNETTNAVVNEPRKADHREDDPSLSLSLGSTLYSSQIPPVTPSLSLAPPLDFSQLMTTWPPADFMPPPSWLSNLQHTGSRGLVISTPTNQPPPVNNFSLAPQSNQTTPPMMRPTNTAVRSSRSKSSAGNQKSETIPPPFPWATNKRGVIHSLEYLESKQITTITGEVHCRYCDQTYQVSYNLREGFAEVDKIFSSMKRIMRERAPPMWTNPEQQRCEFCGREKAVKPVIADRKSQINWLFLLLGQTLGHCSLDQLKNFCKHSKSHRTGAKDRVLYLTYLGLCKMLDPINDLFNR